MTQDAILEAILNSLTDEQKQKLVASFIGEKSHEQVEQQQQPDKKSSSKVNENFTVTREESQRGKQTVKAKKNQWTDDGEDKDVSTPMFEKTPRVRKPHKMEVVECYVCGKEFKIDPKFIHGSYHRCNGCSGR